MDQYIGFKISTKLQILEETRTPFSILRFCYHVVQEQAQNIHKVGQDFVLDGVVLNIYTGGYKQNSSLLPGQCFYQGDIISGWGLPRFRSDLREKKNRIRIRSWKKTGSGSHPILPNNIHLLLFSFGIKECINFIPRAVA